jgi:hypothetical protein
VSLLFSCVSALSTLMRPSLISAGCLHIGNCRLKSNVPWVFVINPLQDVSVLETPSSKVQYRPKVFGPLVFNIGVVDMISLIAMPIHTLTRRFEVRRVGDPPCAHIALHALSHSRLAPIPCATT